jgi:hypothetical protein
VSRERQKARAAREAARRADVEAAAAQRAKRVRRQVLLKRVRPTVPKRRRRYGALTARARYQLFVAFVGVQVVGWYFLSGPGARFSLAVLTAAVLLVLVNTRRSTS